MDLNISSPVDQTPISSIILKQIGRCSSPAAAEALAPDSDQPQNAKWLQPKRQPRSNRDSLCARMNHNNRQRKATQQSRRWVIDSEDSVDLARSRCWLPSDAARKKPRLERQEAFRVPEMVYISDVVENDAELYRLGLLYDDDHVRGSGFSLNTIVHSNPVYPIRPAKRAQRGINTQYLDGWGECDEDGPLILGQLLTSTLDVPSTPEQEQPNMSYPTPASTPRHNGDFVGNRSESETHTEGRQSELEEDFICDWDMLPRLQREYSNTSTVVESIEIDAGVALETWIVLGETCSESH
ncbi:hypothetical protein PFICI_03130 [Pestalotiopsis fici W106-1]|uniref:Uncharacterized protein n=1 Tax=Pestalotiopsis fici (strain W106-1 / CGMCC3.15140) TaxID=1229662 RepID=W3XGE4_PESFW|nr:uncharacterized protein PFICI_03130 [Pestalotiopsis fici W106-1]ETS85105.1 hypothetical protein PFICI_03130 [Pestalotiopsis fici W106-1]